MNFLFGGSFWLLESKSVISHWISVNKYASVWETCLDLSDYHEKY